MKSAQLVEARRRISPLVVTSLRHIIHDVYLSYARCELESDY